MKVIAFAICGSHSAANFQTFNLAELRGEEFALMLALTQSLTPAMSASVYRYLLAFRNA